MICGPQGCGKSTLIREMLYGYGKEAVIQINYNYSEEKHFAKQLFEALRIVWSPDTHPTTFLCLVSENLKNEGITPTLVIEVDQRFRGEDIEHLLVNLKVLGDGLRLVKTVVILSSSKSAFGVNINAKELRAKYVSVADLSRKETELFLDEVFKRITGNDVSRREIVKLDADIVGNRLVDLHNLSCEITELESFEEIEFLQKYKQLQRLISNGSFNELFKAFPKMKNTELLKLTRMGAVNLSELADMLGTTQTNLLQRNSEIHPHVLYTWTLNASLVSAHDQTHPDSPLRHA